MIDSYLRVLLPLGLTVLGVLVTGLGVVISLALPRGAPLPSYLANGGLLLALIGVLWTLIVRPWGLTLAGVLTMGLGALVTLFLYQEVPARSALTEVSGKLHWAAEVRRYRSRREEDKEGYIANYRLEIDTADRTRVALVVPAAEIGEAQLGSLIGQPVVALYNNNTGVVALYSNDAGIVWELTSGTTRFIEYQRALRLRVPQQLLGPSIAGGGLLASALGVLWMLRRRRAREAAVGRSFACDALADETRS
jgi:hypothetical protein